MKAQTKRLYRYILARLQEASSWRGLTLLASVAGATLNPEQKEAIVLTGLFMSGLIGAVWPDK